MFDAMKNWRVVRSYLLALQTSKDLGLRGVVHSHECVGIIRTIRPTKISRSSTIVERRALQLEAACCFGMFFFKSFSVSHLKGFWEESRFSIEL